MAANPGYNPCPTLCDAALTEIDLLRASGDFAELLRRRVQAGVCWNMLEHPNYRCPLCSEAVRTHPTKCYDMKNMVEVIAEAGTEGQDTQPLLNPPHFEQQPTDVWGVFFPQFPEFMI